MRLANKIAIVTGAASGFGRGIAELFAAEGAKVVIADVNVRGRACGCRVAAIRHGDGHANRCHQSKNDVAEMVRAAVETFRRSRHPRQ